MSLVLEVGGSHVTGAAGPDGALVRRSLDGGVDPLAVLRQVVAEVGPRQGTWGVALPGPVDLVTGTGRYAGTGKLEGLDGVGLRTVLRGLGADDAVFVNDADAFALGAWERTGRPQRVVALTLGSGIGSGFVVAGQLVHDDPAVPPEGSAHLLQHDGRPLEESFSRPALRRAWRTRTGEDLDVHEIVRRPDAAQVLEPAARALGAALAPWLRAFAPDVLVVGGSIARSWSLLAPAFAAPVPVVVDTDERTALLGAALHACEDVLPVGGRVLPPE